MGGRGRQAILWMILLLCAGSAEPLRAAAGAFTLLPVASVGQVAPGAGGASFTEVGSSSGPWPTIDPNGRVTFRGVLGFPTSGIEGLWNGTPGALANFATEGQPTPDQPSQIFNFTD